VIGIDFMKINQEEYLVAADYFTKDFLLKKMSSTNATAILNTLQEWMCIHGVPEEIRSDGGPPFNSESFRRETIAMGVGKYTLSSAGNSQSNGFIERMIQTIKATIIKSGKSKKAMSEALLNLRMTPDRDGFAPAELSHGRSLRRNQSVNINKQLNMAKAIKTRKVSLENRRQEMLSQSKTRRDLKPYTEGQPVYYQTGTRKWKKAVIDKEYRDKRSYTINNDAGNKMIRNRRFIRPRN
jgi:hypothetical protein